jgi:hypothetical protein
VIGVTCGRALVLGVFAIGCGGVLVGGCGSTYHPDEAQGAADASADGGATSEGGAGDASDGSACGADLSVDPKNCGRCGHDCLGGACESGKCQGVQLAAPGGPLRHILLAGSSIFVSTSTRLVSEVSGLFRVPSGGGAPEQYAPQRHAEAMGVIGETLYYAVNESSPNPTGDLGGLYSCPLAGPAPCTPTLIVALDFPRALAVDRGRVFYNETNSSALMVYAPPGPPTVFRTGTDGAVGLANNIYVDGDAAFVTASALGPPFPQSASVIELPLAGGQANAFSYVGPLAHEGTLFGTPDSLYFTAFEYTGATSGVVRRLPRGSGTPCDVGGSQQARPYGLHVDDRNVYWSNQGTGAALPFSNGSLAYCEKTGCCSTPTTLWKGAPQPTAITGDDTAIYFATYGGSIWKIAKP